MPIYEYQCEACGEKQEEIQSRPLEEIECRSCGKTARRLVSVFASATGAEGGVCPSPSGSPFG